MGINFVALDRLVAGEYSGRIAFGTDIGAKGNWKLLAETDSSVLKGMVAQNHGKNSLN